MQLGIHAFRIVEEKLPKVYWLIFGCLTLLWIVGILGESFLALGLLAGILALAVILILGVKGLFVSTFFIIPFSAEALLGGGFGTDLPTEPLIIFLAYMTVILGVQQIEKVKFRRHFTTINVLLILHLAWITISAILADNQVISIKYFLAKTWYILPFYFLPQILGLQEKDIVRIAKFLIAGMLLAAVYFFFSHAQSGLTFESRVNVGKPIFRNHVNYACILTICLPFIWYWSRRTNPPRIIVLSLALLWAVFIFFAYARVAYLCIAVAIIGYMAIRLKILHHIVAISSVALLAGIIFLFNQNKYLHYAPDYERTVTQVRFDRLLGATVSGTDISSMERVYRWVAGIEMSAKKPWTGYGPGNFYSEYKKYTISSFQTYVSDNPDKSGIHNYYLMVLVEQGWIGLILWIGLLWAALSKSQCLYHRATTAQGRDVIILATMVLCIIIAMNLINDMIEVVKVGPFFFFALFLLSHIDSKTVITEGK